NSVAIGDFNGNGKQDLAVASSGSNIVSIRLGQCIPTPTPGPCSTMFSENFDGVVAPALPAGWVAINPDPGDGVMWVTSTVAPESAPNDAFVGDQNGISYK